MGGFHRFGYRRLAPTYRQSAAAELSQSKVSGVMLMARSVGVIMLVGAVRS